MMSDAIPKFRKLLNPMYGGTYPVFASNVIYPC
jgi:hypothetical protein